MSETKENHSVEMTGQIILASAKSLLSTIENQAAVIVTDPPYGIAYHSGHYKDKNPLNPIANDWNFQIGPFFQQAEKALKDGGAMYVFTRWDVLSVWIPSIPTSLTLKNCIIWRKNNWSAGDLSGNFGNQYECIMFLTKGRHVLRGTRWSNIWDCPRIPSRKLRVAAEKPVALLEKAILSSTDRGDLVVDPFCGSGSTAEAALKTGRGFLCGDIDIKCVNLARTRLGMSPIVTGEEIVEIPRCPVFNVIPPSPASWGLHPEDVLDFLDRNIVCASSDKPDLFG